MTAIVGVQRKYRCKYSRGIFKVFLKLFFMFVDILYLKSPNVLPVQSTQHRPSHKQTPDKKESFKWHWITAKQHVKNVLFFRGNVVKNRKPVAIIRSKILVFNFLGMKFFLSNLWPRIIQNIEIVFIPFKQLMTFDDFTSRVS